MLFHTDGRTTSPDISRQGKQFFHRDKVTYDIVADASRYCTMKIGDLIVSSSIAGGTLEIGQELTGTIDDTPALTVRVR